MVITPPTMEAKCQLKNNHFWVKNVEKWVILKVIPPKMLNVELGHNQVISTFSVSDNAKMGGITVNKPETE